MRGPISRHAVQAAAAAAWIAAILAVVTDDMPTALHGLADVAAAVLSIWALLQHYGGRRLKPGQRIVSDEEMSRFEESVVRGYREAGDKRDGPRLRSAG